MIRTPEYYGVPRGRFNGIPNRRQIFPTHLPADATGQFIPDRSPDSRYNRHMPDARKILDQQYLEMRWRCLSLAADFDRIERAAGGADVIAADPRLASLREAMTKIGEKNLSRAEFLQMLLSDK
jgi:hypothetical protein